MSPYSKLPLSTTEQIAWFEQERLSNPSNRDEIIAILKYIGFSRFLSYYQIYGRHLNLQSADFSYQTILDDYIADQKLRILVLEGVERIEIAIRSLWTELMVCAGGAFVHLRPEHFHTKVGGNAKAYAEWIGRITKEIRRSHDTEITEYFRKYDTTNPQTLPPLWKSVVAMSLGSISYGVRYTKNNAIKKKIARELGLPQNPEVLVSFLFAISTLRNVCAHHSRLWSQPLSTSMMSTKELSLSGGTKGSLYPVLWWMCVIIRHMSPDSEWPNRLSNHCKRSFKDWQLQKAMGFPKDWDSF